MKLNQQLFTTMPAGLQISDAPEGLSAIHEPECCAVIWRRLPLQQFQSWIESIDSTQLPRARVIVHADQVHHIASHVCNACGTPDCQNRALLIDDVAALADIFSQVIDSPYLLFRFEVVDANSCPELQSDGVTARLICTYRGTGIEYGASLGVAEHQQVFSVPTGSPILMTGKSLSTNSGPHLRHSNQSKRSAVETKLLLSLEPVVEPNRNNNRRLVH